MPSLINLIDIVDQARFAADGLSCAGAATSSRFAQVIMLMCLL
jgi:hypothetical protein